MNEVKTSFRINPVANEALREKYGTQRAAGEAIRREIEVIVQTNQLDAINLNDYQKKQAYRKTIHLDHRLYKALVSHYGNKNQVGKAISVISLQLAKTAF